MTRKDLIILAGIGFISTLGQVEGAPAPQVVTIWQTATQLLSEDGSLHTEIAPTENAAATTTSASSPATTGTSGSTSSGNSGLKISSFLNKSSWDKFLSFLHGGSDNDSSGSTDGSSTASISSDSSPTTAYTQTTSSSSAFEFSAASSEPVETTTSSTDSPSTSTSSSSSSSDSSIYDQIYDSSGIDKTFSKQILDAHNRYRALHDVEELSWDKEVYEYAQHYADKYDCSGVLTHSHGQYGENLAAGFNTGPSAVKAWYDEGSSYSYGSEKTYDHFTQVIWKGSTKVGCAYKDCSAEGWAKYVICSYDPAGNVIGQSSKNVLPQSS